MEPTNGTEGSNGKQEGLFEDLGYTPGMERPASSDAGYAPRPAQPPEPSPDYPQQDVFAQERVVEVEHAVDNELTSKAMEDAERTKAMEDLKANQRQREEEMDLFNGKRKYATFDQEMQNIEMDVANALHGEIVGIKKMVYDVLNTHFGKNLYRGDVLKKKSKLEQKAGWLEKTIKTFDDLLHKECDNDENTPVFQKGAEARADVYKKMCRTTTYDITSIAGMLAGLQKQKAESQILRDKYLQQAVQDPGNEDYSHRAMYYKNRLEEIEKDVLTLQKNKRLAGRKLKDYDCKAVTFELEQKSLETNKHHAQEAMIDLGSAIDLMEHYLNSCSGAKSLAEFQREMSALNTEIDAAQGALQIYATRTTKALERNLDTLQNSRGRNHLSGDLGYVQQAQNRIFANEDREVNRLLAKYA